MWDNAERRRKAQARELSTFHKVGEIEEIHSSF